MTAEIGPEDIKPEDLDILDHNSPREEGDDQEQGGGPDDGDMLG